MPPSCSSPPKPTSGTQPCDDNTPKRRAAHRARHASQSNWATEIVSSLSAAKTYASFARFSSLLGLPVFKEPVIKHGPSSDDWREHSHLEGSKVGTTIFPKYGPMADTKRGVLSSQERPKDGRGSCWYLRTACQVRCMLVAQEELWHGYKDWLRKRPHPRFVQFTSE